MLFVCGALLLSLSASLPTSTSTNTDSPPRLVSVGTSTGAEQPHPAGQVVVSLVVNTEGRAREIQVIESSDPRLDALAIDAARNTLFSPALHQGTKVEGRVRFTLQFPGKDAPVEAREPPHEAPEPKEPEELDENVRVRAQRPSRSATDFRFEWNNVRQEPLSGGSAAELLEKAPGLHLSQHSGEGKAHQIFLRGFDAVHGQDTEVKVAGIPVNEVSNIHGQGYADLHFLIPEVASSMHVIEGAYDPRQGDFAVAGSIGFDLALPIRGVLLKGGYGSFGLVRSLVAYGPPGTPNRTFVAAELVRGDGFGPNRAFERANAMGQVEVELNPQTTARILAGTHASRYDSAGALRVDDVDSGEIDRLGTYDPRQGGAGHRHQVLFEIEHVGSGRSELSAFLVSRDFRLRQNFTGYLLFDDGDLSEQSSATTTFGGHGLYSFSVGPSISAEVGASFRNDWTEQSQNRIDSTTNEAHTREVDASMTILDLGVYADLRAKLSDQLETRLGLRGDALSFLIADRLYGLNSEQRRAEAPLGVANLREALGFHIGPKATLEWRLEEPTLYLSYGNGFRTPQALSLGGGEKTPFTSVHAGELGTRWRITPFLELTAAAFTSYLTNDLVFDHATGQTIGAGESLRSGATMFLEASMPPAFSASLAVSAVDARFTETGAPVPYAPPLVVRGEIDAFLPLRVLPELMVFGNAALSYISPRPLPYSERSEMQLLSELSVGLEYHPLRGSLGIDNLLGLEWRDGDFVYASDFRSSHRTRVPSHHFTAGRPRSLQFTLSVEL